jgi:hypothetical protein
MRSTGTASARVRKVRQRIEFLVVLRIPADGARPFHLQVVEVRFERVRRGLDKDA